VREDVRDVSLYLPFSIKSKATLSSSRLRPLLPLGIQLPRGCPAILVCDSKEYFNVNVPDDLHRKGSDDITLMLKVKEVQHLYRWVNHFILVTGDKDYRELIRELLQNGHFAHVISRASSLGRRTPSTPMIASRKNSRSAST